MSTSPAAISGSDALRGFSKRASRIISNGALYDLVADMAKELDQLPVMRAQLDRIEAMLTTLTKGTD